MSTIRDNNEKCKLSICPIDRIDNIFAFRTRNVLGLQMQFLNKRAQRALGRSPEEKVKGHSRSNNRKPQGHNLNNFGRGPFDDVIY